MEASDLPHAISEMSLSLSSRLDGHNQLPKIIQGVKFIDGLEIAAKLKAPQAKFAAA